MSGFSISGLGSGIDWSAYIQSVRTAKESALQRTLGKKSSKLTSETSVFQNVQSISTTFQNNVKGFQFSRDFLTKTVTSSDSTVVTGTASLAASNQSNTISVEQLATNENWQAQFSGVSNSVTSSAQTLTITVRGTAHVLNVTAGTTLTQLADQINAAAIGVSASVFDTGAGGATPARLSITDSLTGKSNSDQTAGINFNLGFSSTLTALATADFGVAPVVEGKDSQVKVNGSSETIYRDTNTLTDVLPNVTLSLLSADPGVQKTLTVASNTDNGTTKIQDFITKYNTLIKELKKDLKFDLSKAAAGQDQTNPTAGNSTLRSILDQLQSAVLSTVSTLPASYTIRSLADIGVTSTYTTADSADNGMLTLDSTKLSNAMASNFDGVVAFFEGVTQGGVTYNGFSQKIADVLDSFLNSTQGSLTAGIKSIATQNLRLSDDLQKKLDQIQREEDTLKDRFARLETQLSQINSQGDQLNAVFASLTNSSSKKKG
jgi:flagellar hook-associated protein 2